MECFGTIIPVPIDVSGGLRLDLFVNCHELNGVSLRSISVVSNSCIIALGCKSYARKNCHTAGIMCICCAVPCLDNPVIEYISSRCGRCSFCTNAGTLDIRRSICRCIASCDSVSFKIKSVGRIDDIDAICTVKHFAPVGVKIEFLGDPVAILPRSARISIIIPTVQIGISGICRSFIDQPWSDFRVGHCYGLIIRCCHRLFIQNKCGGIESCFEIRIRIPPDEVRTHGHP